MYASERLSFPGQPKKVFDALTCPKKYILFTTEEDAEEHCQSGALALSNQRIFDWLDDTLQISSWPRARSFLQPSRTENSYE